MLQIFVRPYALDLDPGIQHESIPEPTPNEWRHLLGSEGGAAPLFVRKDVLYFACRLAADERVTLPSQPGRDTYLYVLEGAAEVGESTLAYTESAMVLEGDDVPVRTTEDAVLVAFYINPEAPITRQGTIGR